jgi:hypothetical protein
MHSERVPPRSPRTILIAFAAVVALAVAGCGEAQTGNVSAEQESVRQRGEMCERLAPHTEVAQSNCEIELEGATRYAEERYGR